MTIAARVEGSGTLVTVTVTLYLTPILFPTRRLRIPGARSTEVWGLSKVSP